MKNIKTLVLLTASCALMLACSEKAEQKAPVPATPAELSQVVVKDVSEYISTLGTTCAYESVNIVPQVTGQVMKINFKQGAEVKKGDVLFEIDSRRYKALMDSAQADLEKAKSQLKIDTLDMERNAKLVKGGYVDKQTFDSLVAKVAVDKAQVMAARSALENAKLNYQWCFIKSPVDGFAGFFNVDVGNIVSQNQTVLTSVKNIRKMYVDFVVPSQNLNDIMQSMAKNGGKLETEISYIEDTMRHKKRMCQVHIVLNQIRYETGSAVLRGELDNNDLLFWPDQPIKAKLFTNKIKGATLVPEICVQTGPLGPYVYVATPVGNGVFKMQQTNVKTGQHYENNTLWLVEGLKDAKLVATRVSNLRLQMSPLVYRTNAVGAPFGADGKIIDNPQQAGAFIMGTAEVVQKFIASAKQAQQAKQPQNAQQKQGK